MTCTVAPASRTARWATENDVPTPPSGEPVITTIDRWASPPFATRSAASTTDDHSEFDPLGVIALAELITPSSDVTRPLAMTAFPPVDTTPSLPIAMACWSSSTTTSIAWRSSSTTIELTSAGASALMTT